MVEAPYGHYLDPDGNPVPTRQILWKLTEDGKTVPDWDATRRYHYCQDCLPAWRLGEPDIAQCSRCGSWWKFLGPGLLHSYGWYRMTGLGVWWARQRGRIPKG